jgi:hypothetical protein
VVFVCGLIGCYELGLVIMIYVFLDFGFLGLMHMWFSWLLQFTRISWC